MKIDSPGDFAEVQPDDRFIAVGEKPKDLLEDARQRANRAADDIFAANSLGEGHIKALLVGHFEDCRASAFAAGLMRRQAEDVPAADPLPCPWCGGPAVVDLIDGYELGTTIAWVFCKDQGDCDVSGPNATTEAEAIAKWNAVAELLRKRRAAIDLVADGTMVLASANFLAAIHSRAVSAESARDGLFAAAVACVSHEIMAHPIHQKCAELSGCVICDLAAVLRAPRAPK